MPSSTRLSIGGLGLSLSSNDVAIELPAVTRQFEAQTGRVDCHLDVHLGSIPEEDGIPVFDSNGVWELRRSSSALTFRCRSEVYGDEPYKMARFDPGFTRGTIVMNARYFAPNAALDPLGYPLDELLVTNLLARAGGAEMHACGVIDRRGRGFVFLGHSGAGKSTTARLLEAEGVATVISDDRVIVRDQGNSLVIYGTPWHGEAHYSVATSAPLSGVFFLEQAPSNDIIEISEAAAVARLMTCGFLPLYDRAAVDATVAVFHRVARMVPCRVLRFLPDASAVHRITSAW